MPDPIFRIEVRRKYKDTTPFGQTVRFDEACDEFTISSLATDGWVFDFNLSKWQERFPGSEIYMVVTLA